MFRSLKSAVLASMVAAVSIAQADVSPLVVKANNSFGISLFKEILKEQENKNIFISPISATLALSMVYNAARSETQQEMAKAMALGNLSLDTINISNKTLLNRVQQSNDDFKLSFANAIWVADGFSVLPNFTKSIQSFYNGESSTVNFNSSKTTDMINDWVKEKTNGKIDGILEEGPHSDLIMFLANATYFKADWTSPFEAHRTQELPFHLSRNSSVKIPTMIQKNHFQHVSSNDMEAISLPYGENQQASMIVLLPKEGRFNYVEKSLTGTSLDLLAKKLAETSYAHGRLALPKFKMNYKTSLIPSLMALGVSQLFVKADLSGMSPDPNLVVSSVVQKTFVAVDEKGTEAAAVTGIGIVRTSVPTDPPLAFDMKIDRPFFVVIRENTSGNTLFFGKIVDPTKEN